jgi:hypothetical protein
MSGFESGHAPHNKKWESKDSAIKILDNLIGSIKNEYGILPSSSLIKVIEPSIVRAFYNNEKSWGKYSVAGHLKKKYSGKLTHGFFPHPVLIKLQTESKSIFIETHPNLIFPERFNVSKKLNDYLSHKNIESALYKDFVYNYGGKIQNSSTIKQINRIENYKSIMSDWLKKNHTKIDRLSYSTVKKYLDENFLPELSTAWSALQGHLNQTGLIKWFGEIGLNFWVQNNKKDLEKILHKLLSVAEKFYSENGYTPGWTELEENDFNDTNYLRRDGWSLEWTIEELNSFYKENGLSPVPSKSEKTLDEVMSLDPNFFLDEVFETFGHIPNLRTLKQSDTFHDFIRYIRKVHYHTDQTETSIYNSLWYNKFGDDYIKFCKKLISLDGHLCGSNYELVLFNYRFLNGLPNNPHIPYNQIFPLENTNLICDNFTDYVTEITGYNPIVKKHNEYWKKIRSKQDLCKKYNQPFLIIESYKFSNTDNKNYLDYIHEVFSQLHDGLNKPDYFDVIKSQKTEIYIQEIVEFFYNTQHLTINVLKKGLSRTAYRFFMNEFKSLKNFVKEYKKEVFNKFESVKEIKIDFDGKTLSKYIGMSEEEKIRTGLKLLAEFMNERDLNVIPAKALIESQKKYRKINDMFQGTSYWSNIKQKKEGYQILCEMLNNTVKIQTKTDNYYDNIKNIEDDLKFMKSIDNGLWIGSRHIGYKNHFEIRRIHSHINRTGGVLEFRTKHKSILDELKFKYKGKNTKLSNG